MPMKTIRLISIILVFLVITGINQKAYSQANAGPDKEICADYTYMSALDPSPDSGEWSVVSGSGVFADTTLYNTLVTSISPGMNVYRWEVTIGAIIYSDDVVITNNSASAANTGPDHVTCVNYASLSANSPVTGTGLWTVVAGSGNFENPTQYSTVVTNLSPGDNIFRWTVTNGECSSFDEITVTYIFVTADAGPDQEICTDYTTLAANDPSLQGAAGYWVVNAGGGTITNQTLYNSEVTNLSPGVNMLGWTVEIEGMCSDFDEVMITNNLYSASASVAGPTTICVDSADLLGNVPVQGCTGEWSIWAGGGSFDDPASPATRVTGLLKGENTLRWTITKNGCSAHDDVVITNNMVTALAGSDIITCGNDANLAANELLPGEIGLWTIISGTGTILTPSDNETVVTGLGAGVNVFSWAVSGNGCFDEDYVQVSNNSFVITAGFDQHVCDTTVVLQAQDPLPGYGIWSFSGPGVTIVNPTSNTTTVYGLQDNSSHTFRWTVYKNGCSAWDEVIIYNDLVHAHAGGDQSVCAGNTNLAAENPIAGSGYWTISAGAGTITDPTYHASVVTDLGLGTNTLIWTVTNLTCTDADEMVITNNTVTATAGVDQALCFNDAYLAGDQPQPGGYGIWEVAGGPGIVHTPSAFNSYVSNLQRGVNTFRWTVYENGCNNGGDLVQIINNSFDAYAGEDQILAQYDADTYFEAELPPNSTGQWSVLAGSGNIADLNSPSSYVDNMLTGENIFTWSVNNTFTGCSDSDDVSIFVGDFTIECGDDQVICHSTAVMNAEFEPGAVSHEWSIISGGGVFDDIHDPETVVRNIPLGINVYKWTAELDEFEISCTVTITNDSIYAGAGDDATLCEDYHTMNAEQIPGGIGLWSVIGLGGGTVVDNTLYNTLITDLEFGTNLFEWHTTRTESGCESRDTVAITSYANAADAGTDDTISVSSYQLQAVSLPGLNGTWSVEYGNGIFEDNSLANTIVSNLTYGDNIFRWNTSYNGCYDFDDVMITLTVYAGEDFEVEGDTVYLDAVLPEGAIGEWTIMYGTGTFEDDTDPKTRVWDLSPGINILRWTVSFPNRKLVLWDEVTGNKTSGTDVLLSKSLIYPNPSRGIINIISGKSLEKADIEIYNISGSLVKFKILNKSANELKINLSQNKPGMYFIKINKQNSIIIKKLIIK